MCIYVSAFTLPELILRSHLIHFCYIEQKFCPRYSLIYLYLNAPQVPPSRSSSSSSVASSTEPYDSPIKDTIMETDPVGEPPKIKSFVAPGAVAEPSSAGPLVDQEVLLRSIKLRRMQRSKVAETSDAESVQTPGPLGLPTSPILPPAPREVQSTKVSQAWLPAVNKGDTPKVCFCIIVS